ncbi:peptidoglycan DD-metalloendopeptidase family protein [Pseudoalteromonas sp. C2R02]|uniref:M23/M56 family metallopeptidase n=1 Tax=Pseudoalteromonas sp. C2R02 TaxID=2841565 RepID=UPI001C08148E|nr:M23/M56 family metallopeptidase [Pseudoalteromonas sp. C2R02]MBU2968302.1 peptidoglycan DD-metalloendopeptidase family protein [Pseudoalteromonas sp. C2R02]
MLYSLMVSLVAFVIFSGVLFLINNLIKKIAPKLSNFSLFWHGLLFLSLIPLLPVNNLSSEPIIPSVLLNDFTHSHQIIKNSYIISEQVNNNDFSQYGLILLFIFIILGCIVSLHKFIYSCLTLQQFSNKCAQVSLSNWFNTQELKLINSKSNIRLIQSQLPHSPFVYGIFSYTIVIPKNFEAMQLEQQKLLLAHELTHAKRHDPIAVFIYRFCCSIFWFNPFLKDIEKGFTNAMEISCDADVLKTLPNKKSDYARALLSSLKLYQTQLNMSTLTHFSNPKHDKSIFETRIRAAMATNNKNKFEILQKILLLAVFILLGVSSFITKATLNIEQIANEVKGLKPVQEALVIPNFDNVHKEAVDLVSLNLQIKGLKPVKEAWISSNYDEVNEFRGAKPHQGIDFAAKKGTKITASFSGVVLIANDTSLHKNYGKVILIRNSENDMQSLYAHLDSFNVTAGQRVKEGDFIGTVGNSGRVTGPHLHFELIKHNKRLNPNKYLNL